MSAKIDLEYPYNQKWKYGYLVVNGENRRHVCLVSSQNDRTTTSYARYLMAVKMGRFLFDTETVDHIDEDKTNDSIDNLQILSSDENKRKYQKIRGKGRQVVEIVCFICKTVFIRRKGNSQVVPAKNGTIACCSKKCSNQLNSLKLSKEAREAISLKTVLRTYTTK